MSGQSGKIRSDTNKSNNKQNGQDTIRRKESSNDSDLKSALSGLYQSRNESNSSKLSHISSNISSSSISPDDDYGNFVDFDTLPIRTVTSTQSSFAQEDEPQFVLDL